MGAQYSTQAYKILPRLLAVELNQHIQTARKAKQQKIWPPNVSDVKSEVCPGEVWKHEFKNNGTLHITFSASSDWLKEIVEDQSDSPNLEFYISAPQP